MILLVSRLKAVKRRKGRVAERRKMKHVHRSNLLSQGWLAHLDSRVDNCKPSCTKPGSPLPLREKQTRLSAEEAPTDP